MDGKVASVRRNQRQRATRSMICSSDAVGEGALAVALDMNPLLHAWLASPTEDTTQAVLCWKAPRGLGGTCLVGFQERLLDLRSDRLECAWQRPATPTLHVHVLGGPCCLGRQAVGLPLLVSTGAVWMSYRTRLDLPVASSRSDRRSE